ncbi:MAG: ribonuclease HII [Lentisphaerae bacterium RIFOXYB12_FULL_60_10]|nr:MAG: ribonuclease HII [Lentisphaerae bacterium RIFOXYB12_FULL_60_10]
MDEAGRGPLAGPVVAAAVVFPPGFLELEINGTLHGLTDSKRLTPRARDHYFSILLHVPGLQYGIGQASPAEIDTLNILQATFLAMRRALMALPELPDHVLVDGLPVDGLPCDSTSIVHGDSLSLCIAAASVLAKVTRDNLMLQMDRQYPGYGFARHKGYGSRSHMLALLESGPTPIHRWSFRPVREAADIRARKERGE